MRLITRIIAAAGVFSMLGPLPAAADSEPQALSLDAQVMLVRQATQLQLAKVHWKERFVLDGPTFPEGKRFATFEVLSTSSRPGSAVLGRYTVDVLTGDLWDVYICTPVQARAVRRLQVAIRKQIHLSADKYEELVRARTPSAPCAP